MSEKRICPNCRAEVPADAPEGVCPACALRAGFDLSEGPDAPTRTVSGERSEPLPPLRVDELARRLPELEAFELIGQGGMGAVYRARHRKLDRAVAVKVLDQALRDNAAFAERFEREARTLAQLDHPNVVSVYDFSHRDGLYYLVMELVDGVNLRQTIDAGKIEPKEALAMVPHICDALQYAHDRGVVHRDIKPENILVDKNGTIKIADFGLAKLVGGEAKERLTQTAQVMGTPNYMAPEQIENPAAVDHRADIFALGVVFYELLTGELPVGRFPPPSQKVEVDVRLDDVVLRTLEKEPNRRYQQASEVKVEVESLANGEPRPAAGPRAEEPTPYEYRSATTLFGLPLIHIAFARDPKGRRMRLASGIIAIGDAAVGAVAIGAFTFGGITLGGLSIGLVSFGGLVVGLLAAMGGLPIGGFAFGGFAVGFVARGGLAFSVFTEPPGWAPLLGWLTLTLGVTAAGVAAAYAWKQAVTAPRAGRELSA